MELSNLIKANKSNASSYASNKTTPPPNRESRPSELEKDLQQMGELISKIQVLEKQVLTNRMFLNMCIHDMRSPTNSIEFGLKQTLASIKDYQKDLKRLSKKVRKTIFDPNFKGHSEL